MAIKLFDCAIVVFLSAPIYLLLNTPRSGQSLEEELQACARGWEQNCTRSTIETRDLHLSFRTIINNKYEPECKLFPVGSWTTRTGLKVDDLDFHIYCNGKIWNDEMADELALLANSTDFIESSVIHVSDSNAYNGTNRLPVYIILLNVSRSMQINISPIRDMSTIRSTWLVDCYARVRPKYQTLLRLIKYWARKRRLAIKKQRRNRLNGISMSFMVMHYMEVLNAILPSITRHLPLIDPTLLKTLENMDSDRWNDDFAPLCAAYREQLSNDVAEEQTLTALLSGFFHYYGYIFDFAHGSIDVWQLNSTKGSDANEAVYIADPYKQENNLGRVAAVEYLEIIRLEMRRAFSIIVNEETDSEKFDMITETRVIDFGNNPWKDV